MLFPQDLDRREAADVLADAAGLGRLETQQADVIENLVAEGVVGVKAALVAGHREPCAAGDILTGIAHVIEKRALHILSEGLAEQLAGEPVKGNGLALRKLAERQAVDDHE